jgi:hypothetical protein
MDATSAVGTKSENPHPVRHEDRNTWVFTVFLICDIGLVAVLTYYAVVHLTNW